MKHTKLASLPASTVIMTFFTAVSQGLAGVRRLSTTTSLIVMLMVLLSLEQYSILHNKHRQDAQNDPGHRTAVSQNIPITKTPSKRLTKRMEKQKKLEPPEIKMAQWKIKQCHLKGGVRLNKPELQGLPVNLPVKVPVDDIFVHRKNFIKLHTEDLITNANFLYANASEIQRRYKWESCAVVGNSGNLKFTHFGDSIDSHTMVLRTNQAPIEGYSLYVGDKTTFRMLNNLWTFRYINMQKILRDRAEENPQMPLEKGVTLLLSRVTGAQFDDLGMSIHRQRRDVRLLLLSSHLIGAARRLLAGYRDRLCKSGYGPYPGGSTPSSGFVSVYLLMQMCGRVTLYGFGSRSESQRKAKYHYYTGFGSRAFGTVREDGSPVHCWDAEIETLEALSREGKLAICRPVNGNTTEARLHNRDCGAFYPGQSSDKGPAVAQESSEEHEQG